MQKHKSGNMEVKVCQTPKGEMVEVYKDKQMFMLLDGAEWFHLLHCTVELSKKLREEDEQRKISNQNRKA